MPAEVIVESGDWDEAALQRLADQASAATLRRLGLDPEAYEISLLGCDDARSARLNREFRGKDGPTNVLSWPAIDPAPRDDGAKPAPPPPGDPAAPEFLGDLALSWETCRREAAEAGRPLEMHVAHLLVHGVLHLLGYDHIRDADAAVMESTETEILATLGIPDPYEVTGEIGPG